MAIIIEIEAIAAKIGQENIIISFLFSPYLKYLLQFSISALCLMVVSCYSDLYFTLTNIYKIGNIFTSKK